MLTIERLRQVLDYDPDTGIFRWARTLDNHVSLGRVAGTVNRYGRRIRIDGEAYSAEKLAWLYMTGVWPKSYVEPRDGNLLNNAWRNLRLTPYRRKLYGNNGSNLRGVHEREGRFQAVIVIDGRDIHLGSFATPQDAAAVYDAAIARAA